MVNKEIEIVFCNPQDRSREVSLYYDILPIPIAQKYFDAMKECEEQGYDILDKDRFYSFPNCYKNEAWIVEELNRRIDIINAHAPGTVREKAHRGMSQEYMNRLHYYFETYRGPILKPAEFFSSAPITVQRALEDYNLLVHRYDDLMHKESVFMNLLVPRRTRASLTFDNRRPRYPLADEDYQYFRRKTDFGSLLLHYCEVGKTILSVYQDKDEIIGDNNIRPLCYYSSDTILQFHPSALGILYKIDAWLFNRWWKRNAVKLEALGFAKNDPKNAIGQVAVARLNRKKGAPAGLSEKKIVELIANHQYFKSIHCHIAG